MSVVVSCVCCHSFGAVNGQLHDGLEIHGEVAEDRSEAVRTPGSVSSASMLFLSHIPRSPTKLSSELGREIITRRGLTVALLYRAFMYRREYTANRCVEETQHKGDYH